MVRYWLPAIIRIGGNGGKTAMTEVTALTDDKKALAEFKDLVAKTDKKNPSKADMRALRVFLRKHRELWAIAGNLAEQAALQLAGGIDGPAILKESLVQGWDALRDDLGYQIAPTLEKMLIDQVVLCWLRHNLLELQYTSAMNKGMTVARGDLLNRRLAASQRRYLRACETLARVRKMVRTTPALQVNIATAGGQQVNVASTT